MGEKDKRVEGSFQPDDSQLRNNVVHATIAANKLTEVPGELDYLLSLPQFKEKAEKVKEKVALLLSEISQQVKSTNPEQNSVRSSFTVDDLLAFEDAEFENYEPLQDVVDLLLEKADSILDSTNNPSKSGINAIEGQSQALEQLNNSFKGVVTNADIRKPQLDFPGVIDNSPRTFVPLIVEKPNAIIPLNTSLKNDASLSSHLENLGESKPDGSNFANPYNFEIRFAYRNPPDWIYDSSKSSSLYQNLGEVLGVEQTQCTWIDDIEQLESLVLKLGQEKGIAVDLEHHSHRSYHGFTCLMQISTKSEDFLVDCLKLRGKLQQLNVIFTDPSIIKVFHGADMDIQWLQRDLGLYVVNLFDTGQAARVLKYPSASYSYSLGLHCKINANKAFQLADWRIRPLAHDMIKYAREDTRYLLFIFDKMRLELLRNSKDHLQSVLKKSADIASTNFQYKIFTFQYGLRKLERWKLNFNDFDMNLFEKVFKWRDDIAREHDESVEYILPFKLLVNVLKHTPKDLQSLTDLCMPLSESFSNLGLIPKLMEIIKTPVATPLDNTAVKRKNTEDGIKEITKKEKSCSEQSQVSPLKPLKPLSEKEGEEADDAEGAWDFVNNYSFTNQDDDDMPFPRASSQVTDEMMALLVSQVNSHSPFAKLASAMRTEQKHKNNIVNTHSSQSFSKPLQDFVLNIDSGPDVDLLQGPDIVKTMAEIYRVSNRNRKRNKDLKRLQSKASETQNNKSRTDVKTIVVPAELQTPTHGHAVLTGVDLNSLSRNSSLQRKQQQQQQPQNKSRLIETDGILRFGCEIGWISQKEIPQLMQSMQTRERDTGLNKALPRQMNIRNSNIPQSNLQNYNQIQVKNNLHPRQQTRSNGNPLVQNVSNVTNVSNYANRYGNVAQNTQFMPVNSNMVSSGQHLNPTLNHHHQQQQHKNQVGSNKKQMFANPLASFTNYPSSNQISQPQQHQQHQQQPQYSQYVGQNHNTVDHSTQTSMKSPYVNPGVAHFTSKQRLLQSFSNLEDKSSFQRYQENNQYGAQSSSFADFGGHIHQSNSLLSNSGRSLDKSPTSFLRGSSYNQLESPQAVRGLSSIRSSLRSFEGSDMRHRQGRRSSTSRESPVRRQLSHEALQMPSSMTGLGYPRYDPHDLDLSFSNMDVSSNAHLPRSFASPSSRSRYSGDHQRHSRRSVAGNPMEDHAPPGFKPLVMSSGNAFGGGGERVDGNSGTFTGYNESPSAAGRFKLPGPTMGGVKSRSAFSNVSNAPLGTNNGSMGGGFEYVDDLQGSILDPYGLDVPNTFSQRFLQGSGDEAFGSFDDADPELKTFSLF